MDIPVNSAFVTPSNILLSSARRLPWLFRPVMRAFFRVYPYRYSTPHWVLRSLKEILGIRISRKMEVDGFKIAADPFDGPGYIFWQSGLTEPETQRLLSAILRPGMVMVDVGAYVGQFTLISSRVANNEIRIFSFEPTPDVFRQLCRNVKANRCAHVTCIQAALSDTPGKANFYFYPESHDQNSLRALASSDASCVEVAVETIDSISDKYLIDRIDVIKVDVEGNELSVLKGARRSLAQFRPVLIIEVSRHQRAYGYTGADIKTLLREFCYDAFRVQPGTCPPYEFSANEINSRVSHFNIVAIPSEATLQFERNIIQERSTPVCARRQAS
jgi:FkbM family methyltransferase